MMTRGAAAVDASMRTNVAAHRQPQRPPARACRARWPLALSCLLALVQASVAQSTAEDLGNAMVGVNTVINPDARTRDSLGGERAGSGIVIDNDGLVLTIGYLIVEAHAAQVVTAAGRTLPANVVGYDHESGLGLLRVLEPLRVKPLPLGKASSVQSGDPVLIASGGDARALQPARIVATRAFAGSWEYLVERALFTAPPHPAWSGAALITREGKLVGVGSLLVGDARGDGDPVPGNMFVPIDLLPPIMADLIADGRIAGPGRPWLGLAANDAKGHLVVERVTPGGPAEKAGVGKGDVVVGIGGERPKTLADFYRKLWRAGRAGITVALDLEQRGARRRVEIRSSNRLDHLKLDSTF